MTRRRQSIGPAWFIQQPRHVAGWGAVGLANWHKNIVFSSHAVDRVTELGSETSLAPLQWFLPPTGGVEEQEAPVDVGRSGSSSWTLQGPWASSLLSLPPGSCPTAPKAICLGGHSCWGKATLGGSTEPASRCRKSDVGRDHFWPLPYICPFPHISASF